MWASCQQHALVVHAASVRPLQSAAAAAAGVRCHQHMVCTSPLYAAVQHTVAAHVAYFIAYMLFMGYCKATPSCWVLAFVL